MSTVRPEAGPGTPRQPTAVRRLAWVSFWTDVSSKMVRAIEPIFLVDSIGLGRDTVALLEGLAKGADSLLRWISGGWSDRLRRRKPLTLAGYAVSTACRPLLAVARAAPLVVVAKAGDRAGSGLRKAPRNAWLADAAHAERTPTHGAFLYQKALDHAGAATGLGMAVVLLTGAVAARNIIWVSVIPALVGLIVLARTREDPWRERPPPTTIAEGRTEPDQVDAGALRRACWLGLALGLSNVSEKLFVIRAADQLSDGAGQTRFLLGATAAWAVFLTAAIVGGVAQRWAARIPGRTMLAAGLAAHAVMYAGFAVPGLAAPLVFSLFACQGIFDALARPAARALAAASAHEQRARGRVVGAYEAVESLADACATPLAGLLWIQGPGWEAAMLFGLVATVGSGVALARIRSAA